MGFRPRQPFQRVPPIRIHGSAKQQVRMLCRGRGDKFVWDIDFGSIGVEQSITVNHTIQRQQNGLADIFAFGERFGNAVGDQTVTFGQQLPAGDAKTSQVNFKTPAVAQFF
jgi:hypothetical protein